MSDISVERLSPDDAFDLLSHETRYEILTILNDSETPLSFSGIYEQADIGDSGKFNYHLKKLLGAFVLDTDDGYELSRAGKRVVGAVLSGAYTHIHDAKPVEMEATCLECGSPLQATFNEETVGITCTSCDLVFTEPDIPPGVLDGWDREDVPIVVHRWLHRHLISSDLGLCPYCDGGVETVVVPPEAELAPDWFTDEEGEPPVMVTFNCTRCGHSWHATIEFASLAHPSVRAFHQDNGIDLRSTPAWELDWLPGASTTVENSEPLEVAFEVGLEGEVRRYVFDERMELIEEESV